MDDILLSKTGKLLIYIINGLFAFALFIIGYFTKDYISPELIVLIGSMVGLFQVLIVAFITKKFSVKPDEILL